MSEKAGLSVKKSEGKEKGPVTSRSNTDFSQSMEINSPVQQVLHLQRTIGNNAVTRLIQSGVLQAKLSIGQPGDIYEQEADRVARQVMRMSGESLVNGHWSLVGKEKGLVQAKGNCSESSDISSCVESHINALKGKGHSLSPATRDYFEPRFGRDFSQVRVHAGPDAAAIAMEVNARAFTTGRDIFFGASQYSPSTSRGKRLIAHELTHVVQQGVSGTFGKRTGQAVNVYRYPGIQALVKNVQRAPSFEDCSTSQETAILSAITTAQGWVSTALSELRGALTGTMSAHLTTVLTDNFHTTSASDIRQIITGFTAIDTALADSITYECESWCMGEKCGYVYALWTDVHFCPSYFSAGSTFQARCLVHELAHKEAGASGDTYVYDSGYATLTPAEAINNADSYAIFARDI